MKRIAWIGLITIMAFTLFGCGGKDHSTTTYVSYSAIGQWQLFYKGPFDIWVKQTRQPVRSGDAIRVVFNGQINQIDSASYLVGMIEHTGEMEIAYPASWRLINLTDSQQATVYGVAHFFGADFDTGGAIEHFGFSTFFFDSAVDPEYHNVYSEYGTVVKWVPRLN